MLVAWSQPGCRGRVTGWASSPEGRESEALRGVDAGLWGRLWRLAAFLGGVPPCQLHERRSCGEKEIPEQGERRNRWWRWRGLTVGAPPPRQKGPEPPEQEAGGDGGSDPSQGIPSHRRHDVESRAGSRHELLGTTDEQLPAPPDSRLKMTFARSPGAGPPPWWIGHELLSSSVLPRAARFPLPCGSRDLSV